MANYFLVYHNSGDSVVIDDTYINLSLSRKIAVSSLDVVTISESEGYVIKGSLQVRKVPDLIGDETIVAVGGYTNWFGSKDCPHFILNCLKQEGQEYKVKRFVCAADVINGDSNRLSESIYSDSHTIQTGLASDSAPNGLYIYIFAKTPGYVSQENFGLQIFNANHETVFDSRYQYFNAVQVGFWGSGHFTTLNNISEYAIADICPWMTLTDKYEGAVGQTYTFCCTGGHVLIGRGWQGRSSYPSQYPLVGTGMRTILKQLGGSGFNTEIGADNNYIVIDVSGF